VTNTIQSLVIYSIAITRIASSEVFEAEELLDEVDSWSQAEIEELPKLYRRKAREFRRLRNRGEE
jgi:hypothetical protein